MAKFSKESQPEFKRGKGKYGKLLDAMTRAGYTEDQFYEHVVKRCMESDDNVMLTEVLKRFCPAPKPVSPDVSFDFNVKGTPVEKIDSIIKGVSESKIPADIGKIIVDMVKTSMDAKEITELAERLENLEAAIKRQEESQLHG